MHEYFEFRGRGVFFIYTCARFLLAAHWGRVSGPWPGPGCRSGCGCGCGWGWIRWWWWRLAAGGWRLGLGQLEDGEDEMGAKWNGVQCWLRLVFGGQGECQVRHLGVGFAGIKLYIILQQMMVVTPPSLPEIPDSGSSTRFFHSIFFFCLRESPANKIA